MLRRFVELSLEELPVELSAHADADSAWPVLAAGGWHVLVTDLMLPGISGLELLERLAALPEAPPGRTIVFSAGLRAEARARLEALGVWRLLAKPVSAVALARSVSEAIEPPQADVAAASGPATGPASRPAPGPRAGETAEQARAIDESFGGDAALFHAYRARCLQQFPQDLRDGDAALAASDAPALRRVAHNLKSVLLLLGEPDASALARRLETEATGGETIVPALWRALRGRVASMLAPGTALDAGPR